MKYADYCYNPVVLGQGVDVLSYIGNSDIPRPLLKCEGDCDRHSDWYVKSHWSLIILPTNLFSHPPTYMLVHRA